MTRSEFDKAITQNYDQIKKAADTFLKNKRTSAEGDVIGFAYEQTLKEIKKIKTPKSAVKYYIQNIKAATIWNKSAYFKEMKSRLREENIENHSIEMKIDVEKKDDIIDRYLEVCPREDKFVIAMVVLGHDSCRKMSKITTIPRSTCAKIIKDLKERIRKFETDSDI